MATTRDTVVDIRSGDMDIPNIVRVPIDVRKGPWVPATRWRRNGDHPLDGVARCDPANFEGSVVARWRGVGAGAPCRCGAPLSDHGWIVKGDVMVCPGSYVLNHPDGTYSTMSEATVAALYRSGDGKKERRQ